MRCGGEDGENGLAPHSPTKETNVSTVDSFGAKSTLTVGSTDYEIFRIDTVAGYEKLPFSLKVLLENLLRTEDAANITADHIRAMGSWDTGSEPDTEIQFTPARLETGRASWRERGCQYV